MTPHPTHEFTITLGPLNLSDDGFARLCDALYEAGCDESNVVGLGMSERTLRIDFDREAPTRKEAIYDALHQVAEGLWKGLETEDTTPLGDQMVAGLSAFNEALKALARCTGLPAAEVMRRIGDVRRGKDPT